MLPGSCEVQKWPEKPRYTLDMLGYSSDAVVFGELDTEPKSRKGLIRVKEVLKFPIRHERLFFRQGRDGFQRPNKLLLNCDATELIKVKNSKGVMGTRSRKLFFLRVSDSTGVVSLKWVPYAGRDIRRKQTRQSVARGICDELSRPGYASERGESCSAEVDPVIRKFGVVKAARHHGSQFVEKGNRFKISCRIETAKVNPIVEILQNSAVVNEGLTKNYRFRKNGVTHKLTLTPKRGFDKTYEGNWTCRVRFLDSEKNLQTHEESVLLLRQEDPTTEPINTCKQSCNDDFCHNNGQCCIDEYSKIEKCNCELGFYGARCSKLNDANIPIIISLSLFVLFGIAVLIWKTCKSQPSPPATSNNDPRSNRTDETST